jgi:hypothetical protein
VHHLSAFRVVAGVNDANVDEILVPDGVFTGRNNHLIVTDQFQLIGACHMAASALRARFNTPTMNYLARQQIWPVMRSATPTSPPRLMDLRNNPIALPQNEEISIEESNNLGAATEETTTFLFIAPPEWNRNKVRGMAQITIRATAALARVAAGWATGGVLTFTENLRGGWYAITAAYCQTTLCRAFRLNFPRAPIMHGRQLRPGHLVNNAIGDLEPYHLPKDQLGTWGYFHSFEPPTLELYADAAGADVQELRLELQYINDGSPGSAPAYQ